MINYTSILYGVNGRKFYYIPAAINLELTNIFYKYDFISDKNIRSFNKCNFSYA